MIEEQEELSENSIKLRNTMACSNLVICLRLVGSNEFVFN